MATLWIREYTERGSTRGGRDIQVPQEPGTDQTPVTFTTTTQSAAFAASTAYIAIVADADFHYAVGSNPTATTNSLKCRAGDTYHIGVTPGHKIAAVAAA